MTQKATAHFDTLEFRKALGRYPTGVAVIATRDARGAAVGLTCNSFASVSLSPPLILWCMALYSPTLTAFLEAPCFSVNFLSTEQESLSRRFSSPIADRFEGVEFGSGTEGVPLVAGCAGHLECRSETRHYIGDHVIIVGRVLRYAYFSRKPLVFAEGQYGVPSGQLG